MILTFAVLAQVTALAAHAAPPAPRAIKSAPIRVWIADSTVYVRLRDPGYLTVLHVDPLGRIRVLFPLNPDDDAAARGGGTFQLSAPVSSEGGTGTILAARTGGPLQVAGLRAGPVWDYGDGMLFQPTAGNALAALLDIADRMADGRPFDFDATTYQIGRPALAQDPQLTMPVCLSCVRRGTVEQQSTVVVTHSNSVDCSNAVLVNSFCGVVDNSVTNTYVYTEAAPAPEPVYVPYYVPVFIPRRRRAPSPPPPPQERTLAIAFPLRRVSEAVVPPPPPRRRPPVIDVKQPRQERWYAPIEPRQREENDASARGPTARPTAATPRAAAPAAPRVMSWVSAGLPARASMSEEPSAAPAAQPTAGTMSVSTTHAWATVPSSSLLRSLRGRPH